MPNGRTREPFRRRGRRTKNDRVFGERRVYRARMAASKELRVTPSRSMQPTTGLPRWQVHIPTDGRSMPSPPADFACNPPNQPAADLSPSPSARRSARSATRSQARAPGQPAASCPPLCAFAAAIDRTWLLPEPCFPRSSSLYLQLLEAEGGSLLFRSCGEACLPETRREGGGLPL